MRSFVSICVLALALVAPACVPSLPGRTAVGPAVTISPASASVTVPAEIAPLNFEIAAQERSGCDKWLASLQSGNGEALVLKGPVFRINETRWKRLLNGADSIVVTLYSCQDGRWLRHPDFAIYVSPDPMDPYLCYRRIFPGYGAYRAMGIYHRDLRNFDEELIFGHEDAGGARENATCVNCHSFASGDPASLHLHIRGKRGGTYVGGKLVQLKNPDPNGPNPTYVNQSFDGRFVAYSAQKVKQWFHSAPGDLLEVADIRSEILIYDVANEVLRPQPAVDTSKLVLMPVFNPAGDRVYYCSAERRDSVGKVKYALYSVAFDDRSGLCHGESRLEVDTTYGSVSFPRISPDGRYLMYSLGPCGYFHIWHRASDLWLLDLVTGENRALAEINSPDSESCHSWSSNGRWVVFGSRRSDGLYTRAYITHADSSGRFTKPFLLPQATPDHSLLDLFSYNLPEFVRSRIDKPASLDF